MDLTVHFFCPILLKLLYNDKQTRTVPLDYIQDREPRV
jgi:hypothetical protein